jgi:hypothetical protein
MTTHSTRLSSLVLFLFLGSTAATSGQNLPGEFNSDDCYTALSIGAGVASTKVCISSTGNVTKFEAGGVEHVAIGDVFEGYQVCIGGPYGSPFDSGTHSFAFGAPTIEQPNGRNTLPLRITRRGNSAAPIRLVQDFSLRSRPFGPTELIITMKVYNTSTDTLSDVKVWRFFDADVNGDFGDDLAVRTADSAIVMDLNDTSRAMSLSAGILDKTHIGGFSDIDHMRNTMGGVPACHAHAFWEDSISDPGDVAGEVTYEVGNILPGRVKTVEFIYRVQ